MTSSEFDPRYPIVLERILFCSAVCESHTPHASVIYPDTEFNTCKKCGNKQILHYNRQAAVIYRPADTLELEGISSDLNSLAGMIRVRDFGKLGKKDKAFIEKIMNDILAIKRRVERLKGEGDGFFT